MYLIYVISTILEEDSVHVCWLYLIVSDDLSADIVSWFFSDMIKNQKPEAKVGVMSRLEVELVPAYSQSIRAVLIYILHEHQNTVCVTRAHI